MTSTLQPAISEQARRLVKPYEDTVFLEFPPVCPTHHSPQLIQLCILMQLPSGQSHCLSPKRLSMHRLGGLLSSQLTTPHHAEYITVLWPPSCRLGHAFTTQHSSVMGCPSCRHGYGSGVMKLHHEHTYACHSPGKVTR